MPSVESMQLDKYRVLVVDDDRDMVTLLCTWLAEAGFYVDSAPSGADALQRIDITRPNIVVTDCTGCRLRSHRGALGRSYFSMKKSSITSTSIPVV